MERCKRCIWVNGFVPWTIPPANWHCLVKSLSFPQKPIAGWHWNKLSYRVLVQIVSLYCKCFSGPGMQANYKPTSTSIWKYCLQYSIFYQSLKRFFNRLQITKLWAGHDFDARSCSELDLQGSNQNVACDMSSQYGDHFCEIVVKFDFK